MFYIPCTDTQEVGTLGMHMHMHNMIGSYSVHVLPLHNQEVGFAEVDTGTKIQDHAIPDIAIHVSVSPDHGSVEAFELILIVLIAQGIKITQG